MNYEFPELEKQAADTTDLDAEVDEASAAARRIAELALLRACVQATRNAGA